uniref:ANK_REP_REGION domain-containing protein n=1 Tax=Steinernema glaseri TaxID=37863 RepID=A0A1I7Y8G3_9BILA
MNAYEKKFFIDDVLWTDTARPFFEDESTKPEQSPADSQEAVPVTSNELRCSVCKAEIGDNRESFVSHYRTDWHRFNLRRFMRKKPPVDEATFEEILSEDDLSDHDEEDDDNASSEATARGVLTGCREYFRSGGRVLSFYKAIRVEGQTLNEVLDRRMTCAIFMLTGGHFASAIFHRGELFAHKTFHRYVVRAKQGGVQSVMDNRNGAAHSAGSNIRRQNEKMLREEIGEVIKSWKADFLHPAVMPLIFVRCSTYNSSVFFSSAASANTFEKGDKRLRSVPFETKRATLEEVKRVYQQLRTVFDHGSIETFQNRLDDQIKKRQRKIQKQLQKKSKQQNRDRDYSMIEEDSDSSEELENPMKTMIKHAMVGVKKISITPQKFDGISEELIKRIYEAVCDDRASELKLIEEIFNGEQHVQYYTFLRDYRIPPLGNTFLHIAAAKGSSAVVKWLLDVGVNPAEPNNAGGYPVQMAANRAVVDVFTIFRSEHPDAVENWDKCRIPAPKKVDPEVEKRRAEKKKQDRAKKREKQKVKKQAEAQEKAEQEERDRFLNLSDREKRALAAERRIAAMKAEREGQRCFQCGEAFSTTPFEYNDNSFCKIACLHEHRRTHST